MIEAKIKSKTIQNMINLMGDKMPAPTNIKVNDSDKLLIIYKKSNDDTMFVKFTAQYDLTFIEIEKYVGTSNEIYRYVGFENLIKYVNNFVGVINEN